MSGALRIAGLRTTAQSSSPPIAEPQKHDAALRSRLAVLGISLFVYSTLVTFLAWRDRYQINPDGVAYVRNAMHLARGSFWESVSSHWSPLLSWTMAPLIGLGVDGLVTARIALALWGGVLVVAANRIGWKVPSLRVREMLVIQLLIALACARWSTKVITPDLLLGAVLGLYLPLTWDQTLFQNGRTPFFAGLIGGVSYLAKAYGFPFVLAHLSAATILTLLGSTEPRKWSRAARAWSLGLLGFAIVAIPWVTVLSLKYGGLTISTNAPFPAFITSPIGDWGVLHRAQNPQEGRITIWETPERIQFPHWNPRNPHWTLRGELSHIEGNLARCVRGLEEYDPLGTFPASEVIFVVILGLLGRTIAMLRATWLCMTVGIYMAGFLPLWFEPRYGLAVIFPVHLILLFGFLREVHEGIPAWNSSRGLARWVPQLAVLALYGALAMAAAVNTYHSLRNDGRRGRSYRKAGERLMELKVPGPVACSPGAWHDVLYACHHANLVFLGELPDESADDLDRLGIETLIVDRNWKPSAELDLDHDWEPVCQVDCWNSTLDVLSRRKHPSEPAR